MHFSVASSVLKSAAVSPISSNRPSFISESVKPGRSSVGNKMTKYEADFIKKVKSKERKSKILSTTGGANARTYMTQPDGRMYPKT